MTTSLIRIQGAATVQARPDRVLLRFSIKEEKREYRACLEGLALRVHQLRSSVMEAGRDADMLKTGQFQVEPRYDYSEGRHTFQGYEARQDLEMRFPWEKESLVALLGFLSRSESRAEFSVHFEASDDDGLKKEALVKAFRCASERATVLAVAAGGRLGEVMLLEHVTQGAPVPGLEMRMMAASPAPDLVVDPVSLTVEASVTAEWVFLPA